MRFIISPYPPGGYAVSLLFRFMAAFLQIESSQKLCVDSNDNSGKRHQYCTKSWRKHKPEAGCYASRQWNGDCIIAGCPGEVLLHFAIGGFRKCHDFCHTARV